MPYQISKSRSGYKVRNKNTGKTYSKKPLSKKKANKQLAAIQINSHESFIARIDNVIAELLLDDKSIKKCS